MHADETDDEDCYDFFLASLATFFTQGAQRGKARKGISLRAIVFEAAAAFTKRR
jgi:hypothetical protein